MTVECPKETKAEVTSAKPMKVHCHECSRAFYGADLLAKHQAETGHRPPTCKVCKTVFKSWVDLRKHEDIGHEKDGTPKDLKLKLKTKAKPKVEPSATKGSQAAEKQPVKAKAKVQSRLELIPTCGNCKVPYPNMQKLRAHHKSTGHHKYYFQCMTCKKKFEDDNQMLVHMASTGHNLENLTSRTTIAKPKEKDIAMPYIPPPSPRKKKVFKEPKDTPTVPVPTTSQPKKTPPPAAATSQPKEVPPPAQVTSQPKKTPPPAQVTSQPKKTPPPTPVTSQPKEKPAPAPASTQPAPASTQPAPASTQPAPASTQPAPASTQTKKAPALVKPAINSQDSDEDSEAEPTSDQAEPTSGHTLKSLIPFALHGENMNNFTPFPLTVEKKAAQRKMLLEGKALGIQTRIGTKYQPQVHLLDSITSGSGSNPYTKPGSSLKSAPYVVVDTDEALKELVELMQKCEIIAFDLEAFCVPSGRHHGRLSLMQFALDPKQPAYLVDVISIGLRKIKFLLGPIFSSDAITKLMFDVRTDSETLANQVDIKLRNVIDLQLYIALYQMSHRSHAGARVGLTTALRDFLHVSDAKLSSVTERMRNNEVVWDQRPLTEDLKQYAAGDVIHMHALFAELQRRSHKMLEPTILLTEKYIAVYNTGKLVKFQESPVRVNLNWMNACIHEAKRTAQAKRTQEDEEEEEEEVEEEEEEEEADMEQEEEEEAAADGEDEEMEEYEEVEEEEVEEAEEEVEEEAAGNEDMAGEEDGEDANAGGNANSGVGWLGSLKQRFIG